MNHKITCRECRIEPIVLNGLCFNCLDENLETPNRKCDDSTKKKKRSPKPIDN